MTRGTTTTRPRLPGQRAVGELYDRSFAERAQTLEQRAAVLARRMAEHRHDVAAYLDAAGEVAERFGLDGAALEPPLLDLLSWVEPDGEHWRWTGRTNNKGSAVMRYRRMADEANLNTEWSACQWLHRLLAPGHEGPKAMFQRCDAPFQCVRPGHRCLTCKGRADA